MTPEEIKALRRTCAATPGPYALVETQAYDAPHLTGIRFPSGVLDLEESQADPWDNDIAGMVAKANAVPALLEHIDAQAALLASLDDAMEALRAGAHRYADEASLFDGMDLLQAIEHVLASYEQARTDTGCHR